jgi:kynureninase
VERGDAVALDLTDPVAAFRDRFSVVTDGPIYMDGNSLGRPPAGIGEALAAGVGAWRSELVSGWEEWIDLPGRVGDRLGRLIGAAAGQVLVCDSTTVNLYKLAAAALRSRPGRREIVTEQSDFPTDRYVIEGLAASEGRVVRAVGPAGSDAGAVERDIAAAIGPDTALVCLSHVHYRTGLRLDMARLTARAHDEGALILWDLAHSAGACPVELDAGGVDLAVGCTYKYLNGGPGAPGFLYVGAALQEELVQPIWGWFGQAEQFAMGEGYRPAGGVARFLTGTPGILGLIAVDSAIAVSEQAGIAALWAKSVGLTSLLIERAEERLVPLGARIVTPALPDHRGAHVAVAHPRAWAWCRALIESGRVIGDFRSPDVVRLGPAPLYTRYTECFDAIEAMAETLGSAPDNPPARRVT